LSTSAWEKITGQPSRMGPAALIPVYDGGGEWQLFRNTEAIQPGRADPARVDRLRQKTQNLLEHYPDTIPQLEKLGVRVKSLLSRPIKTPADVERWAASIFNQGPLTRAAYSQEPPRAALSGHAAAKRVRRAQANGGPVRPRGRPRKDGLMPGSKEAKAADAAKKGRRVTVIDMRGKTAEEVTPRRRLVRVGA
jgi:hypothetical protein